VRILVVDNYDSFTYNLVQLLETLGADVEVVRNDARAAEARVPQRVDGVVISPGPGTPERAGATLATVERCAAARVPLLGVCLGHQAIGVAFGGSLVRARAPRHGKTSPIRHDGAGCFAGLPDPLEAALYHSLVLDEARLPADLAVSARSPEGEVMALRHRALPLEGVQFHPESVLTPHGRALAMRMLRRHRLIELFLVQTLDLTWDRVHEEAENMEHAVSDLLIDRIDDYLGHPECDPHGDPIPTADGELRGDVDSAVPLADCGPGATVKFVRVIDQEAEFLRYLTDAGFELGAVGTVKENNSVAGIVTVRIGSRALSLGHSAARQLMVERIDR